MIIGAGLPRSGTTSLRKALSILGVFPTYYLHHFTKNSEQAELWSNRKYVKALKGYKATLDYPGCFYWKELADTFTDSKIILTVRDPLDWWESVIPTVYKSSRDAITGCVGKYVEDLWLNTFQGRIENCDDAIQIYEERNQEIINTQLDNRLLVFNVKDGWKPLCLFLDVDIPDELFPHLNKREEF